MIAIYFAKFINDLPDYSLACNRDVIRISKNDKASISMTSASKHFLLQIHLCFLVFVFHCKLAHREVVS